MKKKFAILNLKYIEEQGIFKISIFSGDNELVNKLRNDINLESLDLEIEKDNIKDVFPIVESIKVIPEPKINDTSFTVKTDGYCKIFKSKYNHFLKLSIVESKLNCYILDVAFAVYILNYKGEYVTVFKAHYGQKTEEPLLKNDKKSEEIDTSLIKPKITSFPKIKEEVFSYSDINKSNIPSIVWKIQTKIFGLMNLGNTCFLNSSLQILIHSPYFIENFINDINIFKPSKNTLAYSFFNFLMNIYSKENNIFSPKNLVEDFLKKCDLFSLGEQSDSQRFYRNFTTILEKEFGPKNTCIKDVFEGKIKYINRLICENIFCPSRKESQTEQPFLDIFLSISEESKEYTIGQLINNTFQVQTKKSNKVCECGSNLTLNREGKIYPNKYLSLNIQRGKLSTRSLKQTKIKVVDFCVNPKQNIYYEPYAINIHNGNMDSGHYYSLIKIFDGNSNSNESKWYLFNDEYCNQIVLPESSSEVINVFYKRKN